MAIVILGKSDCSICGEVLLTGHDSVATAHFIPDQSHPLWRYSDAAMHYDCFQQWPHREEYVAEYNRTMGQMISGDGSQHTMQADGTITTRSVVGRT